jgi:disulfide bond formation protein DsbB
VEHPCYRCQALIDEGITFCPHCGAPQIRVIPPEENMPASPPQPPNAPEFPLPIQPTPTWSQGGMPYALPVNAIQWDIAWRGALLAGAGAAVLTAIPFVSLGCCLWMLGAGALAVALYQKRVPGTPITPGMGMRLGALAGVFGFLISAVVTTLSFLTFRSNSDFRRALQQQMEKQMASNPDPKVQEMVQRMLEWMSTPQGAATVIVLVLIVMAVVFVLFCSAGGALGASMFGQRREFR